ncbi:MAG: hypothetical protein M3422_15290, partial [Actinomycetota bacterium]|nr:hypothetical protein [Actinomycetota bacterium]
MALSCPRPGCAGEVVNGNCQECGIAVAETPEQAAARLRREAEERAARLPHTSGEDGTGWFASPDT